MASPKFYLIDTNVLYVAAGLSPDIPAGPAARWMDAFAADPDAKLIVDVASPPGHSSSLYLKPQFLPSTTVWNNASRILREYRDVKLDVFHPYWVAVTNKVESSDQGVVVHVDYDGSEARLEGIASTIDRSDRKFVAAAINFIKHHSMGQRFRPTIVYAADVADWQACRDELERDYRIDFLHLK